MLKQNNINILENFCIKNYFKTFFLATKDVQIMVKIQIIQSDEEVHSLSQDMARLMSKKDTKDTLIKCSTSEEDDEPIEAHSWVIRCRSSKLANRLTQYDSDKNKVNILFRRVIFIQ